MYQIDSKKLKYILVTERCLKLKRVSKMCGMHEDYISKAIELGRISEKVVKALVDKFEINPVRYVEGWKGGNDE